MAKKRRTKKQKKKRRLKQRRNRPKHKSKKTSERRSLFAYDVRLIRADLTKTLVLSILAVAIIVAIFLLRII
jgi:hypothetical protein